MSLAAAPASTRISTWTLRHRGRRVWILGGIAALHLLLALTAEQGRVGRSLHFPNIDAAAVLGDVWQWRHGVVAMRDFGSELGPLAQAVAAGGASLVPPERLLASYPAIRLVFRLLGAAALLAIFTLSPAPDWALLLLGGASLAIGPSGRWTSYRALLALAVAVLAGRLIDSSESSLPWRQLALVAGAWLAVESSRPIFLSISSPQSRRRRSRCWRRPPAGG